MTGFVVQGHIYKLVKKYKLVFWRQTNASAEE